ncbi:hypothetical protein CJ030_MR6G025617 [Morella rubra]|uniref:mTERF domain-containing protein 1, mitochondrial n=1 Tax=Morella rubra TaxID=262757 RepID=A0A6A1VGA9_9ROSI|nr:hypothetical protein CJ030_MR6G025617 [Morella rubra]
MRHFIYKTLAQNGAISSYTMYGPWIQTKRFVSSGLKSPEKQSLTVSYLTDSCGLSLEQAISASKVVKIRDTEKPDLLLKLFTSYGFTKTQISSLVSRHPPLILARPETNIRPKIEYFRSLGFRGPDLPKIICSDRSILLSSLEKQIIPNLDFVKDIVGTNENLVYALKHSSNVFHFNIKKVMVPNIATLRAHGVPEQHVAKLIMMQPRSLLLKTDLFKEVVCEIKEMGFEPMSRSFILAVKCMSIISKVKWEKKKEILKSFGWSENEFLSAFRVQPMLMECSEEKIRDVIDFLMNKAGLKPLDVSRCPNLFLASVERRMIPRYAVLKVLMSKGLIRNDIHLVWALNPRKQDFEKKFVTPFIEDAPEVIHAYQGKIGCDGFSN